MFLVSHFTLYCNTEVYLVHSVVGTVYTTERFYLVHPVLQYNYTAQQGIIWSTYTTRFYLVHPVRNVHHIKVLFGSPCITMYTTSRFYLVHLVLQCTTRQGFIKLTL